MPPFRGLVAVVIDQDTLRGGINSYLSQYLKLRCTMAEHAPLAWSINFEINPFLSFWTQFVADGVAVPQVHVLQNF